MNVPAMVRLPRLIMALSACGMDMAAQQIADADYLPPQLKPDYAMSRGPRVGVDQGHNNFHTAGGRYSPFASLLRRDGYRLGPFARGISARTLETTDILVIANPLGKANKAERDWRRPRESAFSDREVLELANRVRKGGSLLLIIDHSPFPGAADKLARAFGVRFSDGFVYEERDYVPPGKFLRSDGSLRSHVVTDGQAPGERVDSIATFSGSAFQAEGAAPILVLGPKVVSSTPRDNAGIFDKDTPRISVARWLQGAVIVFGGGRVAVFGEAAMFTTQLVGKERSPMGMNHPDPKQNHRLLLNVMRWLSNGDHGGGT